MFPDFCGFVFEWIYESVSFLLLRWNDAVIFVFVKF